MSVPNKVLEASVILSCPASLTPGLVDWFLKCNSDHIKIQAIIISSKRDLVVHSISLWFIFSTPLGAPLHTCWGLGFHTV